MDRLIKEGGLQGNKTYEYDKRGNLIGITDRGKRVRAYEYDTTGRLGLSYSNLGKARSYSYDGLGNRMGIKEYERKIGYGEDGLKIILEENLSELTPSYEEIYILDRTRAYHNLLQNKTIKEAVRQYITMHGTLMLHIWKKGKKSLPIYRMSLEVQSAFLSRVEQVKLYMVMMSLEKIPIAHRDRCSHSAIQAIDMIM
nr:RHS repeat domain-containing protein [uncultured Lachnoanaerobaculum sp.]